MYDVNLGTGRASGYFYHAAAGTALPASPLAQLAAAWVEVGYIAEDGITWATGRSSEPLKDWANKIRRQLQSEPTGTVAAPIISTTAEALKTIFGASNVTETPATTGHGDLVSVDVAEGVVSGEEAFLFIMKDGDDAIMLGTTSGYVTALEDISFAPGSAITWNATVSADTWRFMKDAGAPTGGTNG